MFPKLWKMIAGRNSDEVIVLDNGNDLDEQVIRLSDAVSRLDRQYETLIDIPTTGKNDTGQGRAYQNIQPE